MELVQLHDKGVNDRLAFMQLAFIHAYTKLNRRLPAEADMQRYFRVTPPTVHQMVLNLDRDRFIERIPGKPRSIRVLVCPENLPALK